MTFEGEVIDIKTAKEPNCLIVKFNTQELSKEEKGELVDLKDKHVSVNIKEV